MHYDTMAQKAIKNNVSIEHYQTIKGYDHSKKFDLKKYLEQTKNTGIQASNLGRALEIVKKMREEKCTIFLSYTSNMVSSGVRESIRYLVENKLVDVLCTTAGGIEEDYIKSFNDFKVGDFNAPGKLLQESGIQRIGNIFVPIDRYTVFEQQFAPMLDELGKKSTQKNKEQKSKEETNTVLTPSILICAMGQQLEALAKKHKEIDAKSSILYWAQKNSIPYFCPAPTDGALGDMIYFAKQRNKEFTLDISADMKKIVDISLNAKKAGVICLGGGVAKHHVLNAMIFRDGAEYAVYINTGDEYDASDSGANTQEAITWNKIKPDAEHVKVKADASLVFPLLVEGAFKDK